MATIKVYAIDNLSRVCAAIATINIKFYISEYFDDVEVEWDVV